MAEMVAPVSINTFAEIPFMRTVTSKRIEFADNIELSTAFISTLCEVMVGEEVDFDFEKILSTALAVVTVGEEVDFDFVPEESGSTTNSQ